MKTPFLSLQPGLQLTGLLGASGVVLAMIPGLTHLGSLTVALLIGLIWRVIHRPAPGAHTGIAFSAKSLLRAGIVLLGVRLNLALLAHAGVKILLLDATVILAGLAGITWLGRRLGLDPVLACLIAVDSSICGASAVAATAPSLGARDDETALVIPLGSLIGTAAMLGFTTWQHLTPLAPANYGLLAGATLHEVAQVMAAVHPVPAAVEIGTVTKLTRVILLIPVVLGLNWWMTRQTPGRRTAGPAKPPFPWFVLGFLGVGIINTLAAHTFPTHGTALAAIDRSVLGLATVLLSMAMAGMGLQVDFARLRAHGGRSLATAVLGWCGLAALAATGVWLLEP